MIFHMEKQTIWAHLVHLSMNMWSDRDRYSELPFDLALWKDLRERMASAGVNMVVLDLGDGVVYESHPEIAVHNAWTPARLREELDRMRQMGLEPIPKLNFATSHDAWLGPYARCISTEAYYRVCSDLIAETIGLFDQPRFFHLGMDEEELDAQRNHDYIVIRQGKLFWHDLNFLFDQVEQTGVRPWIWADMIRRMDENEYLQNMSKSVLQSNWFYDPEWSKEVVSVRNYLTLEEHGFDQVPTGSNCVCPSSFPDTVGFSRKHIMPERLHGFMQTTWKPTLPEFRDVHLEAIEVIRRAIGDTT
jgi:hypothetical protein